MAQPRADGGSAMITALFVMVLLTGTGIALLFLSRTEVRMSQADVRSKTAYYLAESALENGRGTLYDTNVNQLFDDDLNAAAGANGVFDAGPATIRAVYDSDGNFTGFTGYGDDVPLRATTATSDGSYIAFLNNDPLDLALGGDPRLDANNRVVVVGVGAGRDRSFEVVEAIIEKRDILPTAPPAAITLLGPDPDFNSGPSAAKRYMGEDCGTAATGLYFPVVGTIGADAETDAEHGVRKPGTFTSGTQGGLDTVADLTDAAEPTVVTSGMGTIDPDWTHCKFLHVMAEQMEIAADVVCTGGTCTLPALTPDSVVFVDGDIEFDHTVHGTGTLFVTGEFVMNGRASWHGLIFVVGTGEFVRSGGGNGEISGAMLVADIAGPDNVYGTSDDCTGGVDGFHEVSYETTGSGTGDTVYCTADIAAANPVSPYDIVSFLQH